MSSQEGVQIAHVCLHCSGDCLDLTLSFLRQCCETRSLAGWQMHVNVNREATHFQVAGRMKVTIKNWHAVASWTWTTEDDVCGICRAWLSSLPVLSESFGPRSRALPHVHLVVHPRRHAARRVCTRCGGSRRRLACRLGQGALFLSRARAHTRRLARRCSAPLTKLLCCAHAVFALLPPDVHHDMAAQQKHMPNLPPKVGVCICTKAGPCDAWEPGICERICSSRSGRTRRRLSFS